MLNRIRSTCGAVGFISYVEEMKWAIFDRIEATTKGNDGDSTLRFSWAADLDERHGATSLPIQVKSRKEAPINSRKQNVQVRA